MKLRGSEAPGIDQHLHSRIEGSLEFSTRSVPRYTPIQRKEIGGTRFEQGWLRTFLPVDVMQGVPVALPFNRAYRTIRCGSGWLREHVTADALTPAFSQASSRVLPNS